MSGRHDHTDPDDHRDEEVGTGDEELAELPSLEAFDLHGYAASYSVRLGLPGFVPDDYLALLDVDASLPTVELCLFGYWNRVEGGYEIQDPELIDLLVQAHADEYDPAGATVICTFEGHVDIGDPHNCLRCHEQVGPRPRDT